MYENNIARAGVVRRIIICSHPIETTTKRDIMCQSSNTRLFVVLEVIGEIMSYLLNTVRPNSLISDEIEIM